MAVTKLTKFVDKLTSTKDYTVRGYDSAKLKLVIRSISGTLRINLYGSQTDAVTTSSPTPEAYIDGGLFSGVYNFTKSGVYEIDINTSNIHALRVAITEVSGVTHDSDIIFSTSFEKFVAPKQSNVFDAFHKGASTYILELDEGTLQLDFSTETIDSVPSGNMMVATSVDGVSYENARFIDSLNKRYISNGALNLNTYMKSKCWLNVEGVKFVRFTFGHSASLNVRMRIEQQKTYIDRTIPNFQKVSAFYIDNRFFKGYQYFKYDFSGQQQVNCSLRVNFYTGTGSGSPLDFKIKKLNGDDFKTFLPSSNAFEFLGNVESGGFIVECVKPIDGVYNSGFATYNTISGNEVNLINKVDLSTRKFDYETNELYRDKNDYRIEKLPSTNNNKDVYNYDVLEYTATSLSFYQGGYYGIKYTTAFDSTSVPSLREGEQIKIAYLLPYDVNDRRTRAVGVEQNPSRIVIFTTHNRVLHNFPHRSIGSLPNSDLFRFDESAVYNQGKKFLPTNDKGKEGGIFKYFPVLKDYDYNQFDGRVAGTDGFVDYFNNGGIPAMTDTPLLDFNIDGVSGFQDLAHSSMSKDAKACVFGNYNVVDGAEPFVMMTQNGGKTWFIKPQGYFACTDGYNYMRGGSVDLSPITDVAPFVANSIKMCRKRFNIPTAEIKEPATPFIVNTADQSLVTNIEVISGETVITVADNLDYDGVYPCVYFENVSAEPEWDYICNNGFNAAGTTNNGVFFRVEKISANKYKLLGDIGNTQQSDKICRHIHAVNRCSAGWLISTGESYTDTLFEGGFIYLMVQTMRNGANTINVKDNTLPLVRLTSSKLGVNRACGAYMFSDSVDPTFMYVGDSPNSSANGQRKLTIPGRTNVNIQQNPTGIYIGKLSDIDEQAKFKCVCEVHKTMIALVQHYGHFAAEGHFDAICFSKNGFDWEIEENHLNEKIKGTDNMGNIYYGDKVVIFK